MNLPPWFACASGMDTIPYEYYSYMRIWDGRQEVLVLGHWEFCPEGAQVIPFLHPYQSHFWDDERLPEADPLGEVPLVLGRWKGTRNSRYTGQCFIGTESDWNAGAGYDTRPNLQTDDEGVPLGCCTLPVGTGGRYYRQQWEEKHWSTLVRTGDRDDGAWHRQRSWQVALRSSAHYAASWDHHRSWQGVYETTDHFAASWHREHSWGAVLATTAHYASSWGQERSIVGVYESTDHFASEGDQERSYAVVLTTSAVEPQAADREHSWSAVVTTSAHFAAAYDRERSWQGVYETLDHFAASWDRERSWRAVEKSHATYAASWHREQSWQALVKTFAAYAASWDREHSWSIVYHTMDNVISFDCGTIAATGSTQGTAAAIANDTVSATSTGVGQGVILPAGCYRIVVQNSNNGGGNSIGVYPPVGAKFGNGVTNSPISVSAGNATLFIEVSATQWRSVTLT